MDHFTRFFLLMAVCFLMVGIVISPNVLAQPPMGQPGDEKLIKKFDKDNDGILNTAERKEARGYWEAEMKKRPRRGPRRRGGREPGEPGPKVATEDVKNYPDHELYDPSILRTIFLKFENEDWEKELEVFKPTDVEVPATMTVDGKSYPDVGVSFRGASSFFMIPAGLKRSLNISMDLADKDQNLYGHKSLNLLNVNGDASMMSSRLYSHIAGQRIATPKVNHVKVVINGESWGIYVSSQQFNQVFTRQHFSSDNGARWKVSGSPRGDGGLRYLGEEIDPYRERFEIKSKDKEKSWKALINLCRVLNETPADELEQVLEPILDIDGCLWFLAVDLALSNSDGYWTRASDYNIYQDPNGKFHILPHDMNEAFKFARRRGGRRGGPTRGAGRPGGDGPPKGGARPPGDGPPKDGNARPRGGGPPRGFGGGGGPTLDPLHGIDDDRMPLRSVLLKHPKFQQQYLGNLRTIAEMLQWESIGPLVAQTRTLLEDEIKQDTRKLSSLEAFQAATSPDEPEKDSKSLRSFVDQRAKFLLNHEKINSLPEKGSK